MLPYLATWLDALGMPVVHHARESFTHDILRGSPGDVYWDGTALHVVQRCPEAWLVHDIAHRIEVLVDRPAAADKVNYGFPQTVFGVELVVSAQWRPREEVAAALTLLLLAATGRPWLGAAARLGDADAIDTSSRERADRVQSGILHAAMTMCLPYADFVGDRLRVDIVAIPAATNQSTDFIRLPAHDIQ